VESDSIGLPSSISLERSRFLVSTGFPVTSADVLMLVVGLRSDYSDFKDD